MKRVIKAGWYVGEPSNFSRSKSGKLHSYYSNPENWEEKQQDVIDFVQGVYESNESMDNLFWVNVGKTPTTVMVQFKPDKSYFKFDLWEDEESLDQQKERFLDVVDDYLGRIDSI